jgi:predicted RNase H-like HicB family nuclease
LDGALAAWQRLLGCLRRIFLRFETEREDDHASWTLTVRVTEDPLDGGWVAECPDLPGCFAQGDTKDEALYNLSDAVAGIVSLRMEQQLSLHSPDDSEVIKVAVAS